MDAYAHPQFVVHACANNELVHRHDHCFHLYKVVLIQSCSSTRVYTSKFYTNSPLIVLAMVLTSEEVVMVALALFTPQAITMM